MVCKECGAYNADYLTHCRVCAAKLRDEPEQPAEDTQANGGRPARRFAQSPIWPKQAFTTPKYEVPEVPAEEPKAAEPTVEVEEAAPAAAAEEPMTEPVADPIAAETEMDEAPEAVTVEEPVKVEEPAAVEAAADPIEEKVEENIAMTQEHTVSTVSDKPAFCAYCGKPLVAGAPFCPYCGNKTPSADDAPKAETVKTPAEEPVKAVPVYAAATYHFDEEKPAEKPAPKAAEPVEEDEEEEEEAPVEEKKSRFGGSRFARKPEVIKDEDYADLYADDDDKDDEDDDSDDSDADDDEYEDDEDYDEDDIDEDDEDDDDDGGKKKGHAGAIVFWILIVVLVLLIGAIGWYFLHSKGVNNISDLKSFITTGSVATPEPEVTPAPEAETAVTTTETGTEISASISDTTLEDGSTGFLIDVTAPAGSKLHVITTAALQQDTIDVNDSGRLQVKVPAGVFLPDDYADTETVSVTPNLEIIEADGTVVPLEVPAVNVTLEPLTLEISEPAEETVEANMDGSPITVTGTVNDDYAEVTVNGESVLVYQGGTFQTTVAVAPTEGETATIEIVAKKINRVTATKTITVTPYEIKDLDLTITSEVTSLRAENGALTVQGTVTPGSTVAFTCDSENVTFGTPTVTEAGNFSCAVTISANGLYKLNVTATQEGYNDASASCYADYLPAKSNTYRSSCTDLTKVYDDIAGGTMTEGNIVFTGKITEIITTEPYTVVRMTLTTKGFTDKEVIFVNRSAKNVIDADDVGKTKQVTGPLLGVYPDTTTPYVWAWFIWNK